MRRQTKPWFLVTFTLLLLVVILLPISVTVAGAFLNASFLGMSTEQWAGGAATSSLHWFHYVWHLYGGSFLFSVRIALFSTLLCLLIGVPGAWVLAGRKLRGAKLVEALVMLPFALPGIALSIALIQAYAAIRGWWGLILCGHLLYTLPLMVQVKLAALRSFDFCELELSASGLEQISGNV